MKLHQLRTFVTITERGSFVAAARVLGHAPPAISKQIAQLERELGARLFVRSAGGVSLTASGEALLVEARTILALNERALVLTQAVARGGREIHMGLAEMLRSHELQLAAAGILLAEQRPGVRLVSHRLSSAEQWCALEARRIDVGVGYGEAVGHPGLACEPLSETRASRVLLPASHPLAARDPLRFRDLAELPLLLFPREANPPLHDRVLAALAARGLVPTVRAGIHSHLAREAAVRAGHGWMLAAGDMPETPGGVELRQVDDPPIDAALTLWWRADETEPAVLAFVEIARAGKVHAGAA
ncbi:MAG TPA: LysR family transcriptional regulator [Longimicrobium sp.]|nr:LysR family transcriptional regulator [Longimicrobium sp.]